MRDVIDSGSDVGIPASCRRNTFFFTRIRQGLDCTSKLKRRERGKGERGRERREMEGREREKK